MSYDIGFLPVPSFAGPGTGPWLAEVVDDYPQAKLLAPLLPIMPPSLGGAEMGEAVDTDTVAVRTRAENPANGRAIELQHDRFQLLWDRVEGEQYPTQDELRPELQGQLETVQRIARDVECQPNLVLRPTFVEVMYNNVMDPVEGVWSEVGQIRECLPSFGLSDLGTPVDAVEFSINFTPSPPDGVDEAALAASVVTLTHAQTGEPAFMLRIVARNWLRAASIDDAVRVASASAEAVVQLFTEMTSERMHEVWGRLS